MSNAGIGYGTITITDLLDKPFQWNHIVGTQNPDISTPEKVPHLQGQISNTYTSVGTISVATRGFRITNTAAKRVLIRFGAGTNASASITEDNLMGLTAGQTYTLSFDARWRVLSGTSETTTRYMEASFYDNSANSTSFSRTAYQRFGTVTVTDRRKDMTGRCEFTFTIPQTATKCYILIANNRTTDNNYASGDYIEILNVMLEDGEYFTSWSPNPLDLNGTNGEDGDDGKGISEIIEYYQISNSNSTAPSTWLTSPIATTVENPYLWNYEEIVYTIGNPYISSPRVIGTRGANGSDGHGYSCAQVILYKRSETTPSNKPGDLTYTFSTGLLSGENSSSFNGWSQQIPSGSEPVWMIAATATGTGTTDTIGTSEWTATPLKVLQNGTNGTNGTNGYNQATLTMYKRAVSEPSTPTSSVTYTFSSGAWTAVSGWSKTVPASDGNPCWVTTAAAISQSASVAVSGWSDVVKMVEDGIDGVDVSSVTWYYKLQESTANPPSIPTTNPPPTGWGTTEPTYTEGDTNSLYVCTLTTFSDGTWAYSDVSLSSSYEAAKVAYNKSVTAQNTATEAKDAVDNLEIGGRNLLLATASEKTSSASSGNSSYTDYYYFSDFGYMLFNGNTEDELTVSFNYETVGATPSGTSPVRIYSQINTVAGDTIYVNVEANETGRYVGTYKLNSTQIGYTKSFRMRVRLQYAANGATVRIWNVKLERGSRATDWTPAPEDIDNAINNLQTNLQSQLDAKIQTWVQNINPATEWTTSTLQEQHNGDLWYYIGTSNLTIGNATIEPSCVYEYDGSNNTWSRYDSTVTSLFDFIDGKSTIFYGTTSGTYNNVKEGDYLVDNTNGSTYYWNGSNWVKATDYQTSIENAIDDIEIGGRNYYIIKDSSSGYLVSSISSLHVATFRKEQTSDFIAVTPGEKLTMQVWVTPTSGEQPWIAYMFCQSDKETVVGSRVAKYGAANDTYLAYINIEVPANAAYVRVSARMQSDGRMKIEKSSMSTDWTPAPEDVSNDILEAVDNISIGGRNLLRHTAQPTNADLWQLDKAAVTDGILTLTPTTALARAKLKVDYLTYGELKNNTYTFSVDIRELETSDSSYTSNTPTLYIGVQPTSRLNAVFSSAYDKYLGIRISDDNWGADWHRYSITLRIPDDFASTTSDDALVDSSYVSVQIAQSASTTPIQIRNPKLELGNKSTDWSSAPEDISAEITNAIDDISIGGRNLLRVAAQEHNSSGYRVYQIPTIDALENDSYILQLWGVTLDAESTGIKPYWGGGNVPMSTNPLMPDENGYICVKWTPTTEDLAHANAQNKYINLYNNPSGHTGCKAKIEKWKLEKGNMPTVWSPAPEDGPGDGINLIVNTLAPDVSEAAKYPKLKGQTVDTGGRGTATVAEHGIRFTNTTANWQFIRFGNSTVTTLDLLGLEPGEIYTYSGEVDFKIFSGSPASDTEYVLGVFVYGHYGSDTSNNLLHCIPIHRYMVSDLTDRGTEFTGIKFTATFALPSNINKLYIDIRGGTEAGSTAASHHAVGDYIEVRNMKIERGSTATDWTPAPEDVDTSITGIQNKITAIYGTCSTTAGTAEKEITCPNFTLYDGATITIKSSTANTAAAPTLNVNNTGAKPVWFNNAVTSSSNAFYWGANAEIQFVYHDDGTNQYWSPIGYPRSYYGTSSTGAGTRAKASTITGAVICKGTVVNILITNPNSYTSNTVQLNISSTGAKNIYVNGAAWRGQPQYNWPASTTVSFTFDGTYWRMQGVASLLSSNGKNNNYYSNTQPSGNFTIGDTWFVLDTNDCVSAVKQWDGTDWILTEYTSGIFSSIDAGKITTGYMNAGRINAGILRGANNQLTYFDLDNAELVTQSIDSNFAIYLHDGMAECERDWLFDGDVEVTKYVASRLGDAGLELISPPHLVMENGQPVIDPETDEREMYKYCAGIGIDRIGNDDVEIFYSEMPLVFIGNDYFPSSASVLDDTKAFSINEWHHTAASYGKFGANDSIEIYGSSNSPYIDFHRSASLDDLNQAVDFDTRLIANAANQLQLEHADGSKTQFRNGNIELYSATGLIDFHFGVNDTSDYTSRIRETSSGVLKSYPSAITSGSDQALKKDILPIDTCYLELIDKLEPKEFRFKDSPKYKHLGFVAQDVEDILDEIGIEDKPLVIPPIDEDDYYALDYQQFIPALVAYCQDLRKEINELKSRLGE